MGSEVNLAGFYPDYMAIEKVEDTEANIRITMRSLAQTGICPVCRHESSAQRSFDYRRNIQDLPILSLQLYLSKIGNAWLHHNCRLIMMPHGFADRPYDALVLSLCGKACGGEQQPAVFLNDRSPICPHEVESM